MLQVPTVKMFGLCLIAPIQTVLGKNFYVLILALMHHLIIYCILYSQGCTREYIGWKTLSDKFFWTFVMGH